MLQNKAKNIAKNEMPDAFSSSGEDSEISEDSEEEPSLAMESESTIKTKGALIVAEAEE